VSAKLRPACATSGRQGAPSISWQRIFPPDQPSQWRAYARRLGRLAIDKADPAEFLQPRDRRRDASRRRLSEGRRPLSRLRERVGVRGTARSKASINSSTYSRPSPHPAASPPPSPASGRRDAPRLLPPASGRREVFAPLSRIRERVGVRGHGARQIQQSIGLRTCRRPLIRRLRRCLLPQAGEGMRSAFCRQRAGAGKFSPPSPVYGRGSG